MLDMIGFESGSDSKSINLKGNQIIAKYQSILI
jgi:hypothetical protein